MPALAANRWTRWLLLDSHFLHHLSEKSEPEFRRGHNPRGGAVQVAILNKRERHSST